MNIIVCLDDNGGIAFNHRRQSMDTVVRERILAMTQGSKLWMNHYSTKQYADVPQANVEEDFLAEAGAGEYCLAEDVSVSAYENWIEKVIVFKWNRSYPYDMTFDLDLLKDEWKLQSSEEFVGHSHERITMEVYTK